jgi:phage regulator Rha-like protein
MSSNALTLTVLDGSPLVDTRLIAAGFGVDHRSTTRLVDNYSEQFQAFGILRFEIAEIKGRGQPSMKSSTC